jgi:aminopeptidase-like protein
MKAIRTLSDAREITSEAKRQTQLMTVNLTDRPETLTRKALGEAMMHLIVELYPLCRSITGNGVRETLNRIRNHIPLTLHEVPSGKQVFDWTVPKEWNIRDAFIKSSAGERIVDFSKCNLHVVGYSVPVRKRMRLEELKPHLFTLPEHPDWIPYRTSYYKETWGFCLSERQLSELKDENYEVCIDATLAPGHLTYGECFLPGESSDEVLISCHTCHPSLCNDNLSGIAVAVCLARHFETVPRRYSYRFLFAPGTIGAITWLALNEVRVENIKHGFVLAGVGDKGGMSYKRSRRGDAEIDRAFRHVLTHSGSEHKIINFSPYGYDERQYCSPGFDLPMGSVMRTQWGQYPEYHTSADNLEFIQPNCLWDSFYKCLSVLELIEANRAHLNQNPKCEPQLGKRGLYRSLGGNAQDKTQEMAMLWVLNLSDGRHTLLDIAETASLNFKTVSAAASSLKEHGLLKAVSSEE